MCTNDVCVYEWCICMNDVYVWMKYVYEWCLCVCINEWCTRVSAHMYMSDYICGHVCHRIPVEVRRQPPALSGFLGSSSDLQACFVNVFNHWAVMPASDFLLWLWREIVSDSSLPCLALLLHVFSMLLTEVSVLRSPEELITTLPPAFWILPSCPLGGLTPWQLFHTSWHCSCP